MPKYVRLSKIKLKGIHFVDDGDNDAAAVTFIKRRPGAAREKKAMPKTAQEILAALPEEDRKVLEMEMARMQAQPAAEAGAAPAGPTNEEMIAKALEAMGDGVKDAEKVRKALQKAMDEEDEAKPMAKDAAPSPDATPVDNAAGEAPTPTPVDFAKRRLDDQDKKLQTLVEENRKLRHERRVEIAKSKAQTEYAGLPHLGPEKMANLLILVEDNLPKDAFETFQKSMRSMSQFVKRSRILDEEGLSGELDDGAPVGQRVAQMAKARVDEERKAGRQITFQKAKSFIWDEHPELYAEYQAERQTR